MADNDIELGARGVLRCNSWGSISAAKLRRVTSFHQSELRLPDACEADIVIKLSKEELQKQDALISFLIGGQFVKGTLVNSCTWYTKYLQRKFYSQWNLLAQALVGLEANSTKPASGDFSIVYSFVIEVARLLKSRKDLALVDIVDELDNQQILKPQDDEERAVLNQVVFATLGWLTMLYEAVPEPSVNKLQVVKTSMSMTSPGFCSSLFTRKYDCYKQNFEYMDSPFFELLGRFGDLIPYPKPYITNGLGTAPASEVITVKHVCFDTLHGLAEMKIEWVTTLALHLEMDSRKKTIKLFQFPSFCRLMVVDNDDHLLSRLLTDQASRMHEDVRAPAVYPEDFFRELLLTYRLIFGQDERSHKAFSRAIPGWEIEEGQNQTQIPSKQPRRDIPWACDPMLLTLCGRSATTDPDARRIYSEIDAIDSYGQTTTNLCYSAGIEFPFFGRRLLELQQFIRLQQPQNVWKLLGDRRDVAAWWTLWNNQVLMVFAILTLIMMSMGLGLQAWQIQLAIAQLQQFDSGGSPMRS